MAIQASDILDFTSSSTAAQTADKFYTMFSRYTDIFTHESGTDTIRIYNEYDITFRVSSGGTYIDILNPDTQTAIASYGFKMGGTGLYEKGIYDVYILVSSTLFYCRYYRRDTTDYRGGVMCFITTNDNHYISMMPGTSTYDRSAWTIESNSAIICLEERDTNYAVKKLAEYNLSVSDLFFSEINLIVSTIGNFSQVTDFCSCSNVTYNQSLNVNNKTYFAIGTNTLVEIELG